MVHFQFISAAKKIVILRISVHFPFMLAAKKIGFIMNLSSFSVHSGEQMNGSFSIHFGGQKNCDFTNFS